jgi:putative mRNA 3-end processing factor
MHLLEFSDSGIYCPAGDFYIDPWRPVKCALITHGHSDHARWGSAHYITHKDTVPIIKYRLSPDISVQGYGYNEPFTINGVKISFHPAGHIIGSAQIRVEFKGEVWVASGDYKLEADGYSVPFEPVPCHTFITECTFGLPVFNWQPQKEIFEDMNQFWKNNIENETTSIIVGYSLGKAQRILQNIDNGIGQIYAHGAIQNMHQLLATVNNDLRATLPVTLDTPKDAYRKALILAPPSALGTSWMKKFEPYSVGIASGWMGLRGARRRRSVDRGFILSDHADWQGLNTAIISSGASKVYATHGYTAIFAKWLGENGIEAYEGKTHFEIGKEDGPANETAETL